MGRVALIGEISLKYIEKLLDIWNNHSSAVLIDSQIPMETSFQMMIEANVIKYYIEHKLFDKVTGFDRADGIISAVFTTRRHEEYLQVFS